MARSKSDDIKGLGVGGYGRAGGGFKGMGIPKGFKPITQLAIAGDSITQQNGDAEGFLGRGYAACGRALLGAGFDFVQKVSTAHSGGLNHNFGYGSYSAANFLNGNREGDGVYPMNDVAAANPQNIFVCLGSNASNTSAADIIAIWDTWRAAGRRVFAAEVLPRHSTSSGYDSTKLADTYALNATLKAAAASRKIPFLEWASSIAESPGGYGALEYIPDAVHPGIRGASVLGEKFAEFFAPYVKTPYVLPTDGNSAWVTGNPYMAGDVSGRATGWTGTGVNLSYSKISDSDGVWQRITAAGASTSQFIRQSSGVGSWAVGDIVRPVARVRAVSEGWAIQSVAIRAVKVGTPTVVGVSHDLDHTTVDGVRLPFSGILLGPRYTIPADATGMFTYLYVAGTGSVDVRQVGLVKI
jgi:hypothetical protein